MLGSGMEGMPGSVAAQLTLETFSRLTPTEKQSNANFKSILKPLYLTECIQLLLNSAGKPAQGFLPKYFPSSREIAYSSCRLDIN